MSRASHAVPSPHVGANGTASAAIDDAAWDAFVAGHPFGHCLQSAAWGRVRAAQGWQVRRVVVDAGAAGGAEIGALRGAPPNGPTAGAQLLVRRRLGGAVAYVPRGPVCAPRDPAWPALRAALRSAARDCVVVRAEPHWPDDPPTRAWLTGQGLRPADPVQPPSTVRVDLARGEDAILAGMKQKWRYNVRLAERSGVTVAEGGAGDLDVLEHLVHATAARHGIGARPAGYHAAVWRELNRPPRAPGAGAHVYVARAGGVPLAAILVAHFGDTATYLYGGSSGEERQRMPNHLLQWAAMRHAAAAGLRWYDFWGIPDAIGQAVAAGASPDDVAAGTGELWGVWGFKRGFGGAVWRSVGAWDDVLAPGRYAIGRAVAPWLGRLAGAVRR